MVPNHVRYQLRYTPYIYNALIYYNKSKKKSTVFKKESSEEGGFFLFGVKLAKGGEIDYVYIKYKNPIDECAKRC